MPTKNPMCFQSSNRGNTEDSYSVRKVHINILSKSIISWSFHRRKAAELPNDELNTHSPHMRIERVRGVLLQSCRGSGPGSPCQTGINLGEYLVYLPLISTYMHYFSVFYWVHSTIAETTAHLFSFFACLCAAGGAVAENQAYVMAECNTCLHLHLRLLICYFFNNCFPVQSFKQKRLSATETASPLPLPAPPSGNDLPAF